MLNLFPLFTNTFLALLFFLAGLIPQLLQKSPEEPQGARRLLSRLALHF